MKAKNQFVILLALCFAIVLQFNSIVNAQIAVVIRTPVGDTYVVDGDDTNHGTEDEVTISGNSDAYIRWRIPSNTTIHIAEFELRRSDLLLNSGQLGIYVEDTTQKFETRATALNREELGLTFDRNEPPAITIDVASDTEFIIFNLSSLPIKNDGLMTLRISSIANSGQSYSFWAREARDPSRIPILSLAFCGDGVTQPPEECDSNLNCTSTCNFVAQEPIVEPEVAPSGPDPNISGGVAAGVIGAAIIVAAGVAYWYFRKRRRNVDKRKYQAFRGSTSVIPNGDLPSEHLERLQRMLIRADRSLLLATTLVNNTDVYNMDVMAKALANIFHQSGRALDLLVPVIQSEVSKTVHEATLFRSNSMASKMMGAWSSLIGVKYLQDTMAPVLTSILKEDPTVEIEPSKMGAGDDLDTNRRNLERIVYETFDAIVDSVPRLPLQLRDLCTNLTEIVSAKFPGSKYKSIGAFFFLRFLTPSILLAGQMGIAKVKNNVPPRSFMLVAKVLTKLANETPFMQQDADYQFLNEFLEKNTPRLHQFYDDIIGSSKQNARYVDVFISESARTQALIVIYTNLEQHHDKITTSLHESAEEVELKREIKELLLLKQQQDLIQLEESINEVMDF
jgi:hypothetical protein